MIIKHPSTHPHRWFMLLLIAITGAISAHSETFTYTYKGTTLKYETIDDTTCKIASDQSVSGDVVIPSRVNTNTSIYTVTTIGEKAFDNCSSLTSVAIPNSVTSIGDYAFSGCSGLTSIDIPNSVTSIEASAFYGCSGLTKAEFTSIESLCSIKFENYYSNPLSYAHELYIDGKKISDLTIPNSVTSIGQQAFAGCSGLTSVTIPNSVTSIENETFEGCTGLTSVTIPNSVTSIRMMAFAYCSGLSSVTIPSSVTSIESEAFSGCKSLTSITIPNSVTSIESGTFVGCSGLTSIDIPNSVTNIGIYAFQGCSGLSSVTIPNSVTSIGEHVFSACSGLTSVTIPNSVTSIGWCAFHGCSGLKSVTIPNSVTSIDGHAFYKCDNLHSVIYDAENPIQSTADVFSESAYSAATLYLPQSAIEAAYNIVPWGLFENVKPLTEAVDPSTDNLKYSFDESTKTCSVTGYIGDKPQGELVIPAEKDRYKVTAIVEGAFSDCSDLTSVSIPNSVTSIGKDAFSECSGLTKAEFASIESICSIKFGNSISNPLYYAPELYIDGKKISDLIIPNSVTSIGDFAFSGYSGLKSVSIPNSVTSIGGNAFYHCI